MPEPHPLLLKLRAERLARGLTQGDVAALMGTSTSGVSVVERGVKGPHLATVTRYADVFGFDITLTPRPLPPITPEQAARNRAVLEAALTEMEGPE